MTSPNEHQFKTVHKNELHAYCVCVCVCLTVCSLNNHFLASFVDYSSTVNTRVHSVKDKLQMRNAINVSVKQLDKL